jgi:hypothetical protein
LLTTLYLLAVVEVQAITAMAQVLVVAVLVD